MVNVTAAEACGVADVAWFSALLDVHAQSNMASLSVLLASPDTLPPDLAGIRFAHHPPWTSRGDPRSFAENALLRSFGAVDTSPLASTGRTPRRMALVVENASRINFVRISRAVIHPMNAPFKIINSPTDLLLCPGQTAFIAVELVMPDVPVRNAVTARAWCIVEVESSFYSCAPRSLLWTVSRSAIGAELRADLVNLHAARKLGLDANKEAFFPSMFAKNFEKQPCNPIMDVDAAAQFMPEGFARLGRTFVNPLFDLPQVDRFAQNELVNINGVIGDSEFALYKRRLSRALRLEAEQMFHDIKAYDICEARLFPCENQPLYFRIFVQGIAESRPALVLFDPVRLVHPSRSGLELVARVTGINNMQSLVTLKLPAAYAHNPTLMQILTNAGHTPARFHVRFCVGSHYDALQKMRLAVNQLGENTFQRLTDHSSYRSSLVDRELRSSRAVEAMMNVEEIKPYVDELNQKQIETVFLCSRKLLEGAGGVSRPVGICFGPPGTGKTRVLTAAIAVSLRLYGDKTRILATAPSHQAADVLCERLKHALDQLRQDGVNAKMFRLNPFERPVMSARPETMLFVRQRGDVFDLPTTEELSSFHVIVSTCASTTLLDLPADHFWTGVYCDEAAQALEPEALIPICRFGHSAPIVLCGDPKQLNATVRSEKAAKLGLPVSLMEKIMHGREVVGNHEYTVQLQINYRVTHPALIEVASRMFYNKKLVTRPKLPRPGSAVEAGLQRLLPSGIPLLFIGVDSPEEKVNERSPGLKNEGEARKITELCRQFTEKNMCRAGEIGVIAPYRTQVQEIRRQLRAEDLSVVKVGTVTDYQGQEGGVILISATISSDKSLRTEQSTHQGFLGSPKMFNVAITRACNLLIVVGNPHILIKDTYWGALLRHCIAKNCYTGVDETEMKKQGKLATGAAASAEAHSEHSLRRLVDSPEAETDDEEHGDDLDAMFRDPEDQPWQVRL